MFKRCVVERKKDETGRNRKGVHKRRERKVEELTELKQLRIAPL